MASSNLSSLSSRLMLFEEKSSLGFTLIYLIFGVPGCFLNILLLSRQQFRTVSCCTYFLGASVSMFIELVFFNIVTIYSNYYENPIYYISVCCKLWFYLHPSISMMFRWMLAVACLDRYALSSTNVRLRRFASVTVARRIVSAIVIMWIILPSPFLVLYDVKAGNCMIIYSYPVLFYNGIFTIINTYLIPISVMTISTILIQQNLAKKRKRHQNVVQQQQQGLNEKEHVERRRDHQALTMLFAQIIVYTIFTTPWVIFSIYTAITLNIQNKSADHLAMEKFVSYLVGRIILLGPTTSFYLYTLTSNMFRKELFNMLHSIFDCKRNVNNHHSKTKTRYVSVGIPALQ